jgi:hypothetical protein
MPDNDFLFQITDQVNYWSEQKIGHHSRHYEWLCDRIEGIANNSTLGLIPDSLRQFRPKTPTLRARGEWNSAYIQTLRTLYSYSTAFREELAPLACFSGICIPSTYPDNPIYTNTSVTNPVNRQMVWLACNEHVGGYMVGAPVDEISLVSRRITASYFREKCPLYFPPGPNNETFGMRERGRTEEMVLTPSPLLEQNIP